MLENIYYATGSKCDSSLKTQYIYVKLPINNGINIFDMNPVSNCKVDYENNTYLTLWLIAHFFASCVDISLFPDFVSTWKNMRSITELFALCKGGNFNINIWAWFGYFIC